MKGKNIGLKDVLPFLFMGVAGANLAAADVTEAGILNFSASEPMEQVVAEAQSWYDSQGYDVSQSVVNDYITNGGKNLRQLPNLNYYLAGGDFPTINDDSSSTINQTLSSVPSLSELTTLKDLPSVAGTSGATLYVLPNTNKNLVNLLIEPLTGGKSAVLIYKTKGADGFQTYAIKNGLDSQLLIDGIDPTSDSYSGAVSALSKNPTYAASMIDGVGEDEITLNGKSLYRFALTEDELRGLGNGEAKVIVVEYNNNSLKRGFQETGKIAANEIQPHSHFYFRMNGSPNSVEFSSDNSFDNYDTIDLNVVQKPVVNTNNNVVLPGVNTPTNFGQDVTFDYETTGKLLLKGLGLYDADGITSAQVDVSKEGTSLGVFDLSGLNRETQTYENGSISGDALKKLGFGDYNLTVLVKDSLGEEASQDYVYTLAEKNIERIFDGLRARAPKDGSSVSLNGIISDGNDFTAANCYLEIYRDDTKLDNINPTGTMNDSYELGDLIVDNQIDLSKLNLNFPEGFALQEGDVVKLYTTDKFDTLPQENDVPVTFRNTASVSSSYGLDNMQDGVTLLAGLGLDFASQDVLPSLYPGQVSTSSDIPQTTLDLGLAWRGKFADSDLARFSADVAANILMGSSAEGLSIDESMDVSNYLRKGADILVRAGYNPRILDGVLELYAGGSFGYTTRSTDLNRNYNFEFNDGASSIPMTDRISTKESILSGGLEGSVKYNPFDFLSIGAQVDWQSISGSGDSTLKSMSAFNEQNSEYSISGNKTKLTGHVAGLLPKLAGLHDLILSGYLGYQWDTTNMTNLDTGTVMNAGQANGLVGGAQLTYNFNDIVGGFVGYSTEPTLGDRSHNVNFGVRFTPTSLGDKN